MELNHPEALEWAHLNAAESNMARCHIANRAEIDRLREALAMLDRACDRRAALLTPDAYNAAVTAPGMREALCALDNARHNARQLLVPNVKLRGA